MQRKNVVSNFKLYGSIVKLNGKRSKPYAVRLTLGYDNKGFPVYEFLDTFDEELDAELCRRDYCKNPYNIVIEHEKFKKITKFAKLPSSIIDKNTIIKEIDRSGYTFKQVYEEYSKMFFPTKEEIKYEQDTHKKTSGKLSMDTMYVRKASYNNCSQLHDLIYKNIRTIDFQQAVNSIPNNSTKKMQRMRYLFLELDDLAEQKDIIAKSYAKHVKINEPETDPIQKNVRIPFTNEEIALLWQQPSCLIRNIVLILLYTGMRIEELLFLFTENIHLKENYLIAGLKTSNGKNRIIPIHHTIKPLIKKYFSSNNQFLFMDGSNRLLYPKYRVMFNDYMKSLGLTHTSHDARHTVESELDRKSANTVAKNLIMGHKNKGTGEDVYTHKSIQELLETIELLSYKESKLLYIKTAN